MKYNVGLYDTHVYNAGASSIALADSVTESDSISNQAEPVLSDSIASSEPSFVKQPMPVYSDLISELEGIVKFPMPVLADSLAPVETFTPDLEIAQIYTLTLQDTITIEDWLSAISSPQSPWTSPSTDSGSWSSPSQDSATWQTSSTDDVDWTIDSLNPPNTEFGDL